MSSDFPQLQDDVQRAVMTTVRAVNALAASDIDFQRSSDGTFARAADATGACVLTLVNALLRNAAAGVADVAAPALAPTEPDDIDSRWADVVDVVDFLLERAVRFRSLPWGEQWLTGSA